MDVYERQLLETACSGSVEAYEKLIGPYQKRIYNLVLKACDTDYDISEITQEVFVRVFKSLTRQFDENAFILSMYKTAWEVCEEFHHGLKMIS